MPEDMPAAIGHNMPPADPTPFELSVKEIDELYGNAKAWADGTPIDKAEHADAIGKLILDLRAAGNLADERRKAEAKPFDDGKTEVQARYNPLVQKDKGRVDMAIATLKKVLEPYQLRKEAEAREEADRSRREAEEARRKAEDAFRASAVTDLAKREEAEKLLSNAKVAEKDAKRAEKQTGAIAGVKLVTVRTAVIDDMTEFSRHVWMSHKSDLTDWMTNYAQQLCNAGVVKIPGVTITETKQVR